MNRLMSIIGGIVVILILAGAAFWEGMNVGKAQAQSDQNAFFASRGINAPAADGAGGGGFGAGDPRDAGGLGAGGAGGAFGGRGGAGGLAQRGAAGTIDKIEGNTITVTSAQSQTVTVNITDNTPIIKTDLGSKGDLKPGARILAIGTRSGSNVAATGIQITDMPAGVGNIFGNGFFGGGGGGRNRATPTPTK